MSFSFSEELIKHYHRELQEVLDRDGIEAFRIGGGETTDTKQLSICFGGDTEARLQSFKNQMKHLELDVKSTQAKYEVTDIGTVHLANSQIGYMLADVIVLCFNSHSSIKKWLQDVEYAFLTLQKPVNKDKSLVISCRVEFPTSKQKFNNAKKQINTLIESLHQIGFSSDVIKINFGYFGLSRTHINELLKEKGKNIAVGYGGMVLIPSGVNRDLPESELGSEIRIEKPFLMSQSQITQKLYKKVTHENPSDFTCEDHPVDKVSWFDLLEFSNKLSGKEACYTDIVRARDGSAEWQEACTGYRLPTEREWEYACRAFSNYTYSGSDKANEVAWFDRNSGFSTHHVGQLKMNGFGLYDMSGNVFEWCWDEYDLNGSNRVLRGGAWNNWADFARVASRNYNTPANQFNYHDFFGGRLVRSLR